MAGINMHPAPGNINKLPPGWFGVRGVADIVQTQGFAVPDRDMQPAVSYTATIGDILATQGFSVPDRSMNPVLDYTTGNVKPLGMKGCGCAGSCGCAGGKLNGASIGDISSDFSAFTGDLSAGNFMAALQAPIMGIPIWMIVAGIVVLPMVLGGGGARSFGRRR